MFDFRGKVLVLTGASGGIPRSVAKTFHDLGASMVVADLDEAGLHYLAAELDPAGHRVVPIRVDVTQSGDCEAAARLCRDRFGGIDFLVTGAGLYLDHPIETTTDEQWHRSMGVNVDGVFYFCRNLIPLLRDGSAIVNIASMSAHRGSYHHAHYAAAKGAVLSFSRSLALELAPRTRVNAVSPGLIETPMVQPLIKARGEQLLEATPLKRLGQSVEVAKVIAFLCSDWASFITGETVHINGGLHIAG